MGKITGYYIAGGCEIDLSVEADAVNVTRTGEAVILSMNNLELRLPADVAQELKAKM
jgi:hypothetical protein